MSPPPAPRGRATRRAPLRRWRARVAGLVLTSVLVAPLTPSAGAQDPPSPSPGTRAADEPGAGQPSIPDPRLMPVLADVAVEGDAVEAALADYRATEARLVAAEELATSSAAEIVDLEAAHQRLTRRATEAERRRAKSSRRLAELGEGMRSLVVADFVAGGTGSVNDPTVDATDLVANDRRRVLVEAAVAEQLEQSRSHRSALALAEAVAGATGIELAEVERRLVATTALRDGALADAESARAQLALDAQRVADERLLAVVVGTDLPLVALDAYVRAAAVATLSEPGCEVPWALLAGIGRTESRNGSYGEAELLADGRSDPPILGIVLDGTRSARIEDTDGGLLDGDTAFDRAVGPMQFIPGTWTRWQRDGNGDLLADPHNLYDASAAAAAYLCASSGALGSLDGARRALLSYNRSTTYGTTVLERATDYAEAVPLPGPQPPVVRRATGPPGPATEAPPPAPDAPDADEPPASPTATLPEEPDPDPDPDDEPAPTSATSATTPPTAAPAGPADTAG